MQKFKINLNSESDELIAIAEFKKQLQKNCGNKSDSSELILRVEDAVNRLMANGRKLLQIGSNYNVRQVIEHSGCQVFITVNMSSVSPSLVSKLAKLFVT